MKVVFILNAISSPIYIKRIDEFVENGYDVDVYGFDRGLGVSSSNYKINVIGEFGASLSYGKRLPIMTKAIKRVVENYKQKDVIYYLFQLDVALAFRLCTSYTKYIYEEPDMMHTYLNNSVIKRLFEWFDKYIIRRSLLSVFTSEGFLQYHYGEQWPSNVALIPNKLNPTILSTTPKEKEKNQGRLRIGFVGMLRYKSIKSFIATFCSNYPDYDFIVYGKINDKEKQTFEELNNYPNYHFNGAFKNPDDLPEIYSNLDLVLATYDTDYENVCYAEPNKIYEAIYFETPIIVSKGTFLEDKVKKLGIGFSLNAMDPKEIMGLIDSIVKKGLVKEIESCKSVHKEDCLNVNHDFFKKLKKLL